jgi:hypothetical protein
MAKKNTKRNTADGSDLSSEFEDLEFTAKDPLGESNDEKAGDGTSGDGRQTVDNTASRVQAAPKVALTESSANKKSGNREKKKGVATLDDYVAYTRVLEASGFFKKYKTTSVNVTVNVSNLSSQISKNYDNIAHYQLVSGIIMKVFNDNKDEVKRILAELARKNTEGLID